MQGPHIRIAFKKLAYTNRNTIPVCLPAAPCPWPGVSLERVKVYMHTHTHTHAHSLSLSLSLALSPNVIVEYLCIQIYCTID